MSAAEADPATMEPRAFAQLIKRTPTGELRDVMGGERRGVFLDGIFVRMPGLFRADRAGAMEAVIHWTVGDRPDGGADTYELVISSGTCRLSARPARQPRLTLTVGALDFLNLVTGNAHPMAMFMTGKLKAAGDIPLATRIPRLFDIPKA
ncbi:SCP2 sterol-binding domain-containing protein [Dactylosporangium sp. NPDC049140]|uniref:SCP2 sterol-binding domain-containing protein n=1 Tax=Dactylosporangium sp. NPDC049140 TaxID=3155647 RepID=UPI0033E31370